MHLEVKVALHFIMSHLYDQLPRRRAELFGDELRGLLLSHFSGHWYPEAPLRGSGFRCLHLGAPPPDPLVAEAARRSGLDAGEVSAHLPAGLSLWIDPFEVSYQVGEKGPVEVLYLKEAGPRGRPQQQTPSSTSSSTSSSPPPPPPSPSSSSKQDQSEEEGHPPLSRPTPSQPLFFTTASFAATKFGSTKMKKTGGGGGGASQQRPSRSPTTTIPGLGKHGQPLPLSLHSLGAPPISQLSPNAKEFVYPGPPGPLYLDTDPSPSQDSPFLPSFHSPGGGGVGGSSGISGGLYTESSAFMEGLGGYGLQYPSQSFQPVVLAN
ncbi:TOB2 protein, partial [Amia calva]|nr:TOB2 protein [Amia calva]